MSHELEVIALALGARAARRVIRHSLVAAHRFQLADVIRQHQHVLIAEMLEVVVDALVLEQPAQEIEIAFAILDAVLPRLIAGAQRELVVVETVPGDRRPAKMSGVDLFWSTRQSTRRVSSQNAGRTMARYS